MSRQQETTQPDYKGRSVQQVMEDASWSQPPTLEDQEGPPYHIEGVHPVHVHLTAEQIENLCPQRHLYSFPITQSELESTEMPRFGYSTNGHDTHPTRANPTHTWHRYGKKPPARERIYKNGTLIERRCSRCKITLPVRDFSKNASAYDGYYAYCKSCDSEMRRIKRPKARKTPCRIPKTTRTS